VTSQVHKPETHDRYGVEEESSLTRFWKRDGSCGDSALLECVESKIYFTTITSESCCIFRDNKKEGKIEV
jgi:hypothetical protein